MNKENLLTVKEAADILRVSPSTVRTMIIKKELSAVSIRSQWRVFRDSLMRYMSENSNIQEGEDYND